MRQRTGRLLGAGLSFLLVAVLCVGIMPMLAEGASWEGKNDADFYNWLTADANRTTVEGILANSNSEEYDALYARVAAIEDTTTKGNASKYLILRGSKTVTDPVKGAIYFDLEAGPVKIGPSGYSGWVRVAASAGAEGIKQQVTGTHKPENIYYIYQSHPSSTWENKQNTPVYSWNTGYVFKGEWDPTATHTGCRVPVYPRVKNGSEDWTKYITNNTEVKDVSNAWGDAATLFGRQAVGNNITFEAASGYTANVILDNIWTSYHSPGGSETRHDFRTSGGIGADLYANEDTHIKLSLKGDNRVGCVHYSAGRGKGNTIEFSAIDKKDNTSGSITVADFPKQWDFNHWCAAIGAADSAHGGNNVADKSDGIIINSGVIYAGTTKEDNCTAIGGGGNQYGGVTINGGIVTAVAAGTGTAIGGGIGYGNQGGDADVTIKGGEIYAYNLGVIKKSGYPDDFPDFVPAAAIGGGGSKNINGSQEVNVTIEGGKVYAQSLGGPGIGGGSSAYQKGGGATINITGGTVIAKSVSGVWDGHQDCPVDAGAAIGGGTGFTQGGTVTLNISQKSALNPTIIRAGSIGGGKCSDENNADKIGGAHVTIKGGDISGQVVMSGGDGTNCTFNMSDGILHGADVTGKIAVADIDTAVEDPQPDVPIEYIKDNGGAVWMQDKNGTVTITGGEITDNKANNGGALYVVGGDVTIVEGVINNNTATTGDGGGICIVADDTDPKATAEENEINMVMLSGSLSSNTARQSGGAMAVETTEGDRTKQTVNIKIGCLRKHEFNTDGTLVSSAYGDYFKDFDNGTYFEGDDFDYGDTFEAYRECQHASCPKVESNKANAAGGAIHINCPSSTLNFFCMTAAGNQTGAPVDPKLPAIKVDGGTVNIGDKEYHNYQFDKENPESKHLNDPRGYVSVDGSVLVTGGQVDIYGRLDNPKIGEVSADIETSGDDYCMDHRFQKDMPIYWVHYFENLNGTGRETFKTYPAGGTIPVKNDPTNNAGKDYLFRGWTTDKEFIEGSSKLYKVNEEIKHTDIDKIRKDQGAEGTQHSLHCPHCTNYARGYMLFLYGTWDKIYTLKKDTDPMIQEALNEAWTIQYTAVEEIELETGVETDDFSQFTILGDGADLEDGAKGYRVKPRGKITFTPKNDPLPIILAFEDDNGKKTMDSLNDLLTRPEGMIGQHGDDPGFKAKVTKDESGVYTLAMPERHVTVSSVWELYLDNGTIELFDEGFRQKDYWYGDRIISWEDREYRILQCEDNNSDGHPTANVLQLYGDLSAREVVLGRLNISSKNSIELINENSAGTSQKAKATLIPDQGGKLQAKNILVPQEATLTLTGSESASYPITLTPASGDAAIGGNQASPGNGNITLNKVDLTMKLNGATGIGPAVNNDVDSDPISVNSSTITVNGGSGIYTWVGGSAVPDVQITSTTLSGMGGSYSAYIVDGTIVNLTNSSIGEEDKPVNEQIHAKSKLTITGSQIYQQ